MYDGYYFTQYTRRGTGPGLAAFDGSYAGRLDDDDVELFTLAEWAKMHAANYVKQTLVGHEIKVAMAAARETADLVDIT